MERDRKLNKSERVELEQLREQVGQSWALRDGLVFALRAFGWELDDDSGQVQVKPPFWANDRYGMDDWESALLEAVRLLLTRSSAAPDPVVDEWSGDSSIEPLFLRGEDFLGTEGNDELPLSPIDF